jgi:2-dehydro-3-deoxyphosphogluconate aldolase/(4S)-4-hydroxy-2-oxoglutarate aldolase
MNLEQIMRTGPVISVLKVEDPEIAIPLAQALVEGGLPVLEVTLRTECALEVIAAMSEVEGAIVGVGTVIRPEQFTQARQVGARFAVTPGLTPALSEAALNAGIPVLPGVMTPSELIAASEQGFKLLKLYPAEVAGGVAMLKSMSGPFPDIGFCPTGGVTSASMMNYLGLPNVLCVGGSWLTPESLMLDKDWDGIRDLARQAVDAASNTR